MSRGSDKQTYGVAVSIKGREADAIIQAVPGQSSLEAKLGSTASGLLADLANGGAMVPPEWAERIQAAIGTTDPAAIVAAVERSQKRRGDATAVEWIVDPTQINFFQQMADSSGITLAHQLKSIIDYAVMQGWLAGGAPDPYKLLVSQEQYRWLQSLFEKDIVTGDDVIEKLRRSGNIPAVVSEDDDDLVMNSLKG